MITPILENLIIQGLAKVNHKTLGQNGVSTISVPENQSIVITKISIQPFVNPSFKNGFGQTGGTGTVTTIDDFTQQLVKAFIDGGGTITNGGASSGNIIHEMLRRGTFQIELSSSDNNNSIFTFGTDYNVVNVSPFDPGVATPAMAMLMPSLSERSTDCYSVHKNNVHIKLRFLNALIQSSPQYFTTQFSSYTAAVTAKNLQNTVPENRAVVDINSPNLYFNTAVYSNVTGGDKFGFYPFGVETNYTILGQFNASDTITFPYLMDNTNVPLSGDGGEASFYSLNKAGGSANLIPYMNMFIPYINVEYVLINEKADGGTIVKANRYNNVTINK